MRAQLLTAYDSTGKPTIGMPNQKRRDGMICDPVGASMMTVVVGPIAGQPAVASGRSVRQEIDGTSWPMSNGSG
jgi:hypothetical protein